MVRAFVPARGCPCPPDQAAHGDDRVGEAEDGVDDGEAVLVAAGESAKGLLPGVRALDERRWVWNNGSFGSGGPSVTGELTRIVERITAPEYPVIACWVWEDRPL